MEQFNKMKNANVSRVSLSEKITMVNECDAMPDARWRCAVPIAIDRTGRDSHSVSHSVRL